MYEDGSVCIYIITHYCRVYKTDQELHNAHHIFSANIVARRYFSNNNKKWIMYAAQREGSSNNTYPTVGGTYKLHRKNF